MEINLVKSKNKWKEKLFYVLAMQYLLVDDTKNVCEFEAHSFLCDDNLANRLLLKLIYCFEFLYIFLNRLLLIPQKQLEQ